MENENEEKRNYWQESLDIIKDIWPKFLFFTICLLFIVFQKSPTKMKLLGQSDEEIKEQQESGDYKTLPEEELYADPKKTNLIVSAVLIVVFFFLRFLNERADYRAELEKKKQAKLEKQEQKEQKRQLNDQKKQKPEKKQKDNKKDKKIKQS